MRSRTADLPPPAREGSWLEYREDSILLALQRCVQAVPDRLFLDAGGRRVTYSEADQLTNRLARGLGVQAGERVAALLANNLEAVLLWIAANKLGAVHVPFNTGMAASDVAAQLGDCAPSVVVVEDAWREPAAAALADLRSPARLVSRDQLMTTVLAADTRPLEEGTGVFDLASIVYTSGTTALPKGCMVSHNYHCSMARLLIAARGRRPEDVVWTPQPIFHMEAMSTVVVQTLLLQGSACLAEGFQADRFWAEIERTGANVVAMLYGGRAVQELAAAPDSDAAERCRGRLRQVVAPASSEVAEEWRIRFGVPEVGINRGYGSTETSMVTITPYGETPPEGASGRRIPLFEVRIVDEDDRDLPCGQTGEIVWRPTRPGIMFDGYWNRPDATAAASRNWWFHGGDLGRMDEYGWLYYAGRKSDTISAATGGVTMFDAETVLLRHAAILEAAVHPTAAPGLKATVVLKPGFALAPDELVAWAAERLPASAVPRYVELRQALPKNATGRVLKGLLEQEGITPDTWSRA